MPRYVRDQAVATPPVEQHLEDQTKQTYALIADAQAFSARLAVLNEIAAALQATLNLDTTWQTLAAQSRWLIDHQHCSVALRSGQRYRVLTLHGTQPPTIAGEYALGVGCIGRALQNNSEMLVGDLADDITAPAASQSAIIVPLRHNREPIGTLNFYATRTQQYSQDDLRVASALGLHVAALVQNNHLFQAITQARDELHTILESIGDAVLVIDASGRILLLNRALRLMFRLPSKDITGRRALLLLRLARVRDHLGSRAALRQHITAWSSDKAHPANGTFTLQDGRSLEWARVPLGACAVQGIVITLRDISDRIALDQLRIDLTHTIVHDLRTPLTTILMGIELLQADIDDHTSPLHNECMRQVYESANHLIEHVNTILDVSKLEANQLMLACKMQSLAPLVHSQLVPLQTIAQRENIDLQSQLPDYLPCVSIDGALIGRVITNLVGNALAFSPPFGQVRVSARFVSADDMVEVQVTDQGPGVSAELRQHIFEKYAQGANAPGHKGSGIGLFFCRLAVESHGGKIGVRPAPGGGSVFWFTLPLDQPAG